MSGLKPCPFCGKTIAVVSDVKDCEKCANFENEKQCPAFENVECDGGCFIICPVMKGGCGSATGWHKTVSEAMDAWNRRLGDVQNNVNMTNNGVLNMRL